jgi:hypothetical protein
MDAAEAVVEEVPVAAPSEAWQEAVEDVHGEVLEICDSW